MGEHPSADLTPGSRAAIAAVRRRAVSTQARSVVRIERALAAAGLTAEVARLGESVLSHARVTLNFHPDRVAADGRSVAEALRDEGVYRSQYETRISGGGLTAYPGGDRDEWERTLFAGAYQDPAAPPTERPKYGGLNLAAFANGPAPAFGSCAVVLGRRASERTTLLFGDSSETREAMGTADALEPVLAALLERIAATRQMVGRPGVSSADLVNRLLAGAAFAPTMCRVLDDYIETHTHGAVELRTDADAFLLDPSFRGTPTGAHLGEAAARHGLRVVWHPGSVLSMRTFPSPAPAARDPHRWEAFLAHGAAARLAARVIAEHSADGERLTAAAIGAAAAAFERDPESWRQWGAPDPSLIALKDLWRILAAYGTPL